MICDEYIAINSKRQILFLFIPTIILILLDIIISISSFLGEDTIFLNLAILSVSSLLSIFSIHFYFQPNVAIKIHNNIIYFYKRSLTHNFNISEILKIKINANYGSFDTTVYTIDGNKKSFHFFIKNSNKKKAEYIKYFEDKGIKVIKVNLMID